MWQDSIVTETRALREQLPIHSPSIPCKPGELRHESSDAFQVGQRESRQTGPAVSGGIEQRIAGDGDDGGIGGEKLPHPVSGSLHGYKYRLAFVVKGACVLRYDNEAGKGDHRHWDQTEERYAFTDIDRLVTDFFNDVSRWRDEHSHD